MARRVYSFLDYLGDHFVDVIALVLIWRGLWFLLDQLDYIAFGGSHTLTALIGLGLGFLMLYKRGNDPK